MVSTFKSARRVILMLLVLLFATGLQKSYACHFAAADIYVTYSGDGVDGCSGTTEYKYDVTLVIYFGCQTCYGDLGTSTNVSYRSANAGFSGNMTVTDVNADPDTVHSLCPAFEPLNSCKVMGNANIYPAFRRRIYTGSVILPSPQTDWVFSWTSGARNANILNVANSSSLSIYIEAGLNNFTKYNNSTPRFLSNPLPYICINQPTTYLNGPYDPNGDSMVIFQQLACQAPLPGGAIPYISPYSLTDPIASSAANPYKLNPVTGTATFTPTVQGFFLFAFRAEEFERGTGTPLGYIWRDVQVSVLPCTAPPPGIDSVSTNFAVSGGSIVKTSNQGYATFVCPGSNLKFDIHTQTDSATHQVYMESNSYLIPGSSWSTVGDGTNNVTGTFTWTPTTSDYGDHTFIVITKDSTCQVWQPIVLKNYTVVLIKVVKGLDAGPDLPVCELNPLPRQLFVKGAENLRVKWTNVGTGDGTGLNKDDIINPIASVNKTTTYKVFTPDLVGPDKGGTCINEDEIVIYTDTTNTINAFPNNPFILCRPDYVQLDAIITGKGPISNLSCGIGTIAPTARIDSVAVYGSPVYGDVPYDTLGPVTPIFPNYTSSAKMQFLIRKEELREKGVRSCTLRDIAFEITNALADTNEYNNFRIGLKCTNKNTLSKTSGFESGVTNVYTATGPTLFQNGWKQIAFDNAYNWDTTKNLIVEFCYSYAEMIPQAACGGTNLPSSPIIKFAPTTYNSAIFVQSTPFVASQDMCGTLTSSAIIERLGRPVVAFNYTDAPELPFKINWTPGDNLSDSTIQQPLSYVNKSIKYIVQTYGNSGCYIRDSVDIFVPKHDFRVTPLDTAICFGEVAAPKAYGGFVYKWYEYTSDGKYVLANNTASCFDCPAPILKPLATTTYKIEIGDSVFCFDTLTMRVKVLPLPKTDLLNHDTTIKYGQSIQLLANGAKLYNWTQASTLDNPNISYPIATPTGPTTYVVTGLTADGCRSTDSVRVNIDYRDNLFVPSAFSPNGDGKNDVFRVSNLTVQRVMEFRVYNRWGQEIYFANNNKGWDGTWKNIPQDIGNYTYFIKVAYPDGLIENYKGEVTLVR